MHLIFANVYVKFNEIGRMALLPPYVVLHVKGNTNLKSRIFKRTSSVSRFSFKSETSFESLWDALISLC